MPPIEPETTHLAHRRRASERLALAERGEDEAYGVPRRFGMGTILIAMSLFAALLGVLRAVGAEPVAIGVLVAFISLVAVGQMFLWGGRRPRAASILVGAISGGLIPLGIGLFNLLVGLFYGGLAIDSLLDAAFTLVGTVFGAAGAAAFGALLGYTAGGVVAGVFLIMDHIDALLQWRHERAVGPGNSAHETPDPLDAAPPRAEPLPQAADQGTPRSS